MACIWCSCSRPPEICVVLSNKRCQKRTCEWQEKSLLPNPSTLLLFTDPCWTSCPCIFQWGRFSVDWLQLFVSYSWGSQVVDIQELTSLVGRLNLVTTYSRRRKNSFARCYKRSCEAITVICLQTLETFLPEYRYHYSLDGNNKFVLCHGLGPI